MSPEVIRAKLSLLQQVLLDLKPHVEAFRQEQEKAHYEIERQVQLAVDLCVALGRRILVVKSIPLPESSRQVFPALVTAGLMPRDLGERLAASVGLRNLLVHEYGSLDYALFYSGLRKGYEAFVEFSGLARDLVREA